MMFLSNNLRQTLAYARRFAATLKGGDVVVLSGELGAGKTHFCKGLAKGLGVKEEITSPTFTLHNSYKGRKYTLEHFDFYRLTQEEGENLGFEEIIGNKCGITVIEWAQNCPTLLPSSYYHINVVPISGTQRKLEIVKI